MKPNKIIHMDSLKYLEEVHKEVIDLVFIDPPFNTGKTQKPLTILERIITVHSNPKDKVLDFFAGSGTTGEAAGKHGREFIMVDENPEAIEVMNKRLGRFL